MFPRWWRRGGISNICLQVASLNTWNEVKRLRNEMSLNNWIATVGFNVIWNWYCTTSLEWRPTVPGMVKQHKGLSSSTVEPCVNSAATWNEASPDIMKIVMCVPESTLVHNILQFPAEDPTLQKLQRQLGRSHGFFSFWPCLTGLSTWSHWSHWTGTEAFSGLCGLPEWISQGRRLMGFHTSVWRHFCTLNLQLNLQLFISCSQNDCCYYVSAWVKYE